MIFSADDIFRASIDDLEFTRLALEAFRHQASENPVYQKYLHLRNYTKTPTQCNEIPFLPIELFKSHTVLSGTQDIPETIFTSSGTTGTQVSKHFVTQPALYERSFLTGFEHFFGTATQFHFLALLPSYLERNGSSLIYMVEYLMKISGKGDFYLYDHPALDTKLADLEAQGIPSVLFGVSYALMDFAEKYPRALKHCRIIETGGMKGTRKELTKKELHQLLSNSFGELSICSEYGMTELLSQAYSQNSSVYTPVPWLKALVRDPHDPFAVTESGKGALNFIDLANLHSCCFIETHDLGSVDQHQFEVYGRMDNAQIRGCNLLVQ